MGTQPRYGAPAKCIGPDGANRSWIPLAKVSSLSPLPLVVGAGNMSEIPTAADINDVFRILSY